MNHREFSMMALGFMRLTKKFGPVRCLSTTTAPAAEPNFRLAASSSQDMGAQGLAALSGFASTENDRDQ